MLALFKKKNPYVQPAKAVYAALLEKTRSPVFYAEYAVPDTFDGRFDLLVVHLFLIINRMTPEGKAGRDFNQALFDTAFADMDQTLREHGIGDMGIPKHMKRMMKAFNGRMHAYNKAFSNDNALEEALMRNLYGTAIGTEADKYGQMRDYMRRSAATLEKHSAGQILSGSAVF